MEFATEMIIKASLSGARINELPITLHPTAAPATAASEYLSRRLAHAAVLLMCTSPALPDPGAVLLALGLAGFVVAMPGMTMGA
jgi:hypothetical protein